MNVEWDMSKATVTRTVEEAKARQEAMQRLADALKRLADFADEFVFDGDQIVGASPRRPGSGQAVPGEEMSCPKHRQPCAECERLQEIEASALQGLADALGKFMLRMDKFGYWDEGCFYYQSRSTPELQEPIDNARAALEAAKPFLEKK